MTALDPRISRGSEARVPQTRDAGHLRAWNGFCNIRVFMEREVADAKSETPTATALLRAEHDLMLGVIETVARTLDVGGRLADETFWHDAIAFFRGFAEDRHHAKEEGALFPVLEMRGAARIGGISFDALRREHQEGKALVESLAALYARLDRRTPEVRTAFLRAVHEYCARLVRHVARENEAVLPVAERLLSASDQREVLKTFLADHGAVDDSLLALADRLRRR
jgi:hemerythrin-like domain-containing protein